jgi:C_GCAxxG_C_C family probable redox protein
MSENKNLTRAEKANELHNHGFNCAQAVACAFTDKTGLDEKTLFCITEGLGLGMGGMEGTCGAISAACVLSGLKCSTGNTARPDSKAVSYKASRACIDAFLDRNGSVICRELKGVDTGRVLRPCPGCIEDAVHIIEEQLYPEEDQ